MFFTTLFGLAYIGLSLSKAFRREVEMPNGENKYFPNYYAIDFSYYAKMLTAL